MNQSHNASPHSPDALASSRDTPVVEVRDVVCTYGDFTAVDAVTFTVEPGQCMALLGTNGAGKTTLLDALQGHRNHQSGSIRVFGENPADRGTIRDRIGIMLQESPGAEDLTLRESVQLMGKLSGRDDNVDRLLEATGLDDQARTRVGQLSGGERRRMDFAIAVWGDPELVFLDEPSTGMDAQSRSRLWRDVRNLQYRGTTVVLTTHYLEEAQSHADTAVVMHEGRVHAQGSMRDLLAGMPGQVTMRDNVALRHRVPADATITNDRLAFTTNNLQRDLTDLLLWARDNSVQIQDLEASPGRLEDVFDAVTTSSGR